MNFRARRAARRVRRAVTAPLIDLRASAPRRLGGWTVAPPDYVGVGVQRAGTSWWNRVLNRHPDVHDRGPSTKELHFYDSLWEGEFGDDQVRAYHRRFARPPGKQCGEWTPRYMFDPWTPALLRQAAPDAKLLVLLRDPVARMQSGVTHEAERGRKVDEMVVATAIARGFYHNQLTHLLRSFPRSQVLVLQLERCTSEPDAMLERTLGFLGLRADVDLASSLRTRVNTRKGEPVGLPLRLLAEVKAQYEADVSRLAADFPEVQLGHWPHFAHLG